LLKDNWRKLLENEGDGELEGENSRKSRLPDTKYIILLSGRKSRNRLPDTKYINLHSGRKLRNRLPDTKYIILLSGRKSLGILKSSVFREHRCCAFVPGRIVERNGMIYRLHKTRNSTALLNENCALYRKKLLLFEFRRSGY